MSRNRSAKAAANRRARAQSVRDRATQDSFQNFQAKLGIGTDNMMSGSTYGFNPVTRISTMLEWIHRGSWLGGVAVDVVADDMTRAGVELKGQLHPGDTEEIDEAAVEMDIWGAINDTIKWSRLYGGCLAVMLVDGQDPATPLREETVGLDQFKGLLVLDRWMVQPSFNDLITVYGPELGLPKFYQVTANAPALPLMRIHHSRCIRLDGIRLPYRQRLTENMWGLSVLERLYDRMVAFDSASTGAAQLVYKSYLRTFKIKGMREVVAAGGQAVEGLTKYVNMMAAFQGIEGITMIDGDDEFAAQGHSAFSGLSDALLQFGQQLSGALQIPLVRLFGQSPAGLNSTGESDLRTYYDGIKQQQEKTLRVGMTRVYRMIAASRGITLPEGFRIEFRPLWQLTEPEKAEIASKHTESITKAYDSGLISPKTGMEELRQSSHTTGVYGSITDEDIEAASEDLLPSIPEGEHVAVKEDDPEAIGGIKLPSDLPNANP